MTLGWLFLGACTSPPPPGLPTVESAPQVFVGGQLRGSPIALRVENGRFTEIGPTVNEDGAERIDLQGAHIVPSFVDSHVHLAFLPRTEEMLNGGVAAVVDWARPLDQLPSTNPQLQTVTSGPMITAPMGYPTQTWGRDGYGLETEPNRVVEAVEQLVRAGATVIKVPLETGTRFDRPALNRIVEAARERNVRVGMHTLGAADAALACEIGADFLVHTPTEMMSDTQMQIERRLLDQHRVAHSSPARQSHVPVFHDHHGLTDYV